MSAVGWVVVAIVVVVLAAAAVIVVRWRGRIEGEIEVPGHRGRFRAGRDPALPAAVAEDVKGRNVETVARGDAQVRRVEATGDVNTRAGVDPGSADPKA